jgi:large subunit ribosomal protein L24
LQIERSIDASNVKLYCSSCSSPARLGYRFTDDGSKERFCKKCGAANGTVSPAKARYAKS